MSGRLKQSKAVQICEQHVSIPTYPAAAPDRNPMFLENRVYQGSSGKVYPNPFTDKVSLEKCEKKYRVVFLENEYIRLMVLPEIGGRIHVGQDKTNNYDFFYHQTVIKPALVGLLGPWISGGVEFNWPQHHRPSTFMPVQYSIEEAEDGSCTVWLSEHEPMNRMKGMVGICLRPDKAFVEARVRLYNRTPFVQTFLWWANVGVHVHDQYQAFFPPDVHFVADHAKRAVSSFPIARNFYYGVDYTQGVDIAWYKNIPVPTSYMVTKSKYDFFGGYDHAKKAGIVHVADHHIAPGKKLWTWGNADFGYAWDRNLTDSDGPYIELMAGVYTDNQPDFSFLHPFETRSFSQFWYPIQEIGPAKNANRLAAVNLELESDSAAVGVCVTEPMPGMRVQVRASARLVFETTADVEPGRPFKKVIRAEAFTGSSDILLRVVDRCGREVIRYQPERPGAVEVDAPATEPPPPSDIENNDRLFVTGLHLEQYRHATRSPELYWREALRRDPLDSRCNNAIGLVLLKRGQFADAEEHFRTATERLTERNPNPYDGEAYYNLGLALRWQVRPDEAYDAFYKATWNYAWQSASYYALATLDCMRADFASALAHLDQSLATNAGNLKARDLKAVVLRRLGRTAAAHELAQGTLGIDPLDFWAGAQRLLASDDSGEQQRFFALMQHDTQTVLDIAFDYAEGGIWDESVRLLEAHVQLGGKQHPMVFYALAYFNHRLGNGAEAGKYASVAAAANADYCFPARLEELIVLEWACAENPNDAKARYYLGNLLYDKRRYEEAIGRWEESVGLDPSFSIPWRNLGIAYFNIQHDAKKARIAYERAFHANAADARLLYELDQLDKRMGVSPRERLACLEANRTLVDQRDDLTVELVTLYNQVGHPERALQVLGSRQFGPWEGGEGLVSGQYVWAHLLLGRALLDVGKPAEALAHFDAARSYPHNLGEGKHLLTSEVHLDYLAGMAARQLGRDDDARGFWTHAAESNPSPAWLSYFKAKALAEVGQKSAAEKLFNEMKQAAERQMRAEVKIDYFATSLPNFLLFADDLAKRNEIECLFTVALAEAGLGQLQTAEELLRRVLSLDVNHLAAQVELAAITGKARLAAGSGG